MHTTSTTSTGLPGGTWTLGDRTVTRFGYGAMQLRYGFRRLEAVSASRTEAPAAFTDAERVDYEAAQSALLKSVGRDSGEPALGAVGVVRNVLEQFVLRWF